MMAQEPRAGICERLFKQTRTGTMRWGFLSRAFFFFAVGRCVPLDFIHEAPQHLLSVTGRL